MPVYSDAYSLRPAYSLRLNVSTQERDIPNNRSRFAYRLYHRHDTSASNNTYSYNTRPWAINIGGWTTSGSTDFLMGPSGDFVGKEITIASGTTGWITHDPDGTLTVNVSASHTRSGSVPGDAALSGSFEATAIPRAPGAPTLTLIDNITPTGFRANFTPPSNVGGSPIIDYDVQYSTSPSFTSPTTVTGASSPISATGLTANTLYYVRVRATNTQGDGEWSTTLSFTTAAAGAPHVGVVPNWDGKGFWIILTRPFGVATTQSYKIRRTVPSTLSVTDINVVATSDTVYFDPFELGPGQTVNYQATATVSSVETGLSASVSFAYNDVVPEVPFWPIFTGRFDPPAPFDNQSCAWVGTADASASRLLGTHPSGWRTFAEGASGVSGAAGAVTQVRKAYGLNLPQTGDFDVMAIFANTQASPGIRIGTSISQVGLAEVFETVVYYGSMRVMSDVQTALALEIEWYTEAEGLISRSIGATVVVDPGEVVELQATGVAPAGATKAAITSVDVTDDAWAPGSLRFCGSAMLTPTNRYSYFDGDTPATTNFDYEWEATAHASPSVRVALSSEGVSNSLQDPALPALPSPPRPPVIDDTAVLSDIVWRRTITSIAASDTREWIPSVPTLSIRAVTEDAQEVRIRYWRNVNGLEPDEWVEEPDELVAEQVIAYIPFESTLTLDGSLERAYVVYDSASPGDPVIPAEHLLYGAGGGPATWPVLDSGFGYIVTFDVPVTAADDNLEFGLLLTDRMI